jgi:phasin
LANQQNNTLYEVPAEMREFAEKSVEQARKAIDGFMSAAHRAVETFAGDTHPVQASATQMSRKTLSYAEQNIAAALDHAKRLVKTKDPVEAIKLQSEFAQSQFAALQSQMQEFGNMIQKNAQDMPTKANSKRA